MYKGDTIGKNQPTVVNYGASQRCGWCNREIADWQTENGIFICPYCRRSRSDGQRYPEDLSGMIPHYTGYSTAQKCQCGEFLVNDGVDTYCPECVKKEVPMSQDEKLEQDFRKLLDEAFELWKKKNASYGNKNISECGEPGIFVRVFDKVQRLKRLVWENKENPLTDENIENTWLDAGVYCMIAVLVRRGQWPK